MVSSSLACYFFSVSIFFIHIWNAGFIYNSLREVKLFARLVFWGRCMMD